MKALQAADITLGEVHIFNNTLDPDDQVRQLAINDAKERLALADEFGAASTVNIAGSLAAKGANDHSPGSIGIHPENQTAETFALIVDTVRDIIDAVNPNRTFYTLELFPRLLPNTTESYLELIKAIDRKQFAVHLDLVNTIDSAYKYFYNTNYINEVFAVLAPYIKSGHIKDIVLQNKLAVQIDVAQPGKGNLDFTKFLQHYSQLHPDTPLFINNFLGNKEDYVQGLQFLNQTTRALHVAINKEEII